MLQAHEVLAGRGIKVRSVSMPCMELFKTQPQDRAAHWNSGQIKKRIHSSHPFLGMSSSGLHRLGPAEGLPRARFPGGGPQRLLGRLDRPGRRARGDDLLRSLRAWEASAGGVARLRAARSEVLRTTNFCIRLLQAKLVSTCFRYVFPSSVALVTCRFVWIFGPSATKPTLRPPINPP